MNLIPTLSVIGCGRLGKTITRLFHEKQVFQIVDILNRSLKSSDEAVRFVGAGRPIDRISNLEKVDVILISAADANIKSIAQELRRTGSHDSAIIFHASGSLSYHILDSLAERGALTASVHPMVTFSDPERATQDVPGSYCSIEGHPDARNILGDAFRNIGSNPFDLGDVSKSQYHAAAVFVSNYVTAVVHTGLDIFTQVGFDREHWLKVLQPGIASIVNSLFEEGTVASLTGPISRGDVNVIEGHLNALKTSSPENLDLYRHLALATVPISREKGLAASESLNKIEELLNLPEFKTASK